MANWYYSELKVSGPLNKLKDFDNQFKKEHKKFYGGTIGAGSKESFIENNNMDEIVDFKVIKPKEDFNMNHVNYIREVKTFKDRYSFTNFVEMTQEDFLNGWYGWSIDNWGTKWDLANMNTDLFLAGEIDPYSYYFFDTANSPATPAVKEMSKQYPDLDFEFSYHELCF